MLSLSSRPELSKLQTHVRTYAPDNESWSADQFTYNEDDDRAWKAIVAAFFGLANAILFFVPVEGLLLDIFLNAAMAGSEIAANKLVDQFIHPDPQIDNGGLNYVAGGETLYFRGPDGNFTSIGSLNQNDGRVYKHPARVTANAVNYMTNLQGVHHNYVVLLKNGVAYRRAMLEADANTNATWSTNPRDATDSGTSGSQSNQPLLGPDVLVAYPRSARSIDKATTLRLYRMQNQQVTGNLTDYVASRAEDNDGFIVRKTYFTYDTTNAQLQPDADRVIYNKVVVTRNSPALTGGFAEYYFYTGGADALPFAPTTDTNAADYPQIVAGQPYFSRNCTYDVTSPTGDSCRSESENASYYTIYTPAAVNGRRPFFARATRTDATLSGRRTTSTAQYDPTTGLLTTSVNQVYDGAGAQQTITTTYERIADVYTASSAALRNLNLIAPVVRTTRRVTNATQTNVTATIELSLWQNWNNSTCSSASPGPARWAPSARFVALNNNPGTFNFATGTPDTAANWQRTDAVSIVDCQFGVALETLDAAGASHSLIYDRALRKPVASFSHASVSAGQAAFTGLEEYEDLSNFTISGTIDATRGHTGRRSLSGPNPRLTLNFFSTATPGATQFVATAFVRPTQGSTCNIRFASTSATSPAGTAAGQWFFLSVMIDSLYSPSSTYVSCPNGGAIDDFAVYPAGSHFSGVAYDPTTENVLGNVRPNGQAIRVFYDSLGRVVGTTGATNLMSNASTTFYSRCELTDDACTGAGEFSQSQANQVMSLTARGGGPGIDFSGMPRSEASALFTFGTNSTSAWGVNGDRLVLAPGNSATLQNSPTANYAVRLRVSQAPLVQQLFVASLSGSSVQSQRSPALATYQSKSYLYAADTAGNLFVFDPIKGTQLHRLNQAVAESSNLQIDGAGNVIVTDQQGALVAYNPYLAQQWRSSEQVFFESTAPAYDAASGLTYAIAGSGDGENTLKAINRSGATVWTYDVHPVRSQPALDSDGTIYVTGPDGLIALDFSGSELFRYGDQQFFGPDAPVVSPDGVVYAVSGNVLYAYQGNRFSANRKIL